MLNRGSLSNDLKVNFRGTINGLVVRGRSVVVHTTSDGDMTSVFDSNTLESIYLIDIILPIFYNPFITSNIY